MIKIAPRKFRHAFVMKYTTGKELRTFAASKSPDRIPIEVNTEASFDFPRQWIWLKMNDLILLSQSKNKQRKKTKYLKIKLSYLSSTSVWKHWSNSQGSQEKGLFFASLLWPMLPHYWRSPTAFFLLLWTLCIQELFTAFIFFLHFIG